MCIIFYHSHQRIFFTAEVAAFRASVYRDCKSDDDLSCSQALNASFFARIASLTSWFHQGVLFSLSPATQSRFRPQLLAADEMIADLKSSHSLSMFSDTSGSCLNLDDMLDANCFLTSLSSKASHLIRQVTDDLLDLLFGQGFESRKEHTTRW